MPDTIKEWSPAKRGRRCFLYGMAMAALVMVLEGAVQRYVITGALGLTVGTLVGGTLVAAMMAILEEGFRWYFLCRGEKQPGFDRYAFRSYFGSVMWISIGFVGILSVLTAFGSGFISAEIRWQTIFSQFMTAIWTGFFLWKSNRIGALIGPMVLHFLWLAPLTIVLPGSDVVESWQRSVVTFLIVFVPLFYLASLVIWIRNRKRVRSEEEYIPAGHAVVRRKKKKDDADEHPSLSQMFAEPMPEAETVETVDADEATSAEMSDANSEPEGSKDISDVTDHYASEKVEDQYL